VHDSYQIFSGRIYKVGLIRFVGVPPEISRALADGAANVPVEGTVEGIPLKTTLVPQGKGCHRLAIHSEIRKKLRIDAGAIVEAALQLDEESREPALPPALTLTLRNAPKAQATFRSMTIALRRQIVRYLINVKQKATLERRIAVFVRRLERRSAQAPKKSAKRRSVQSRKS
jgi:hypothetical protein